METKLSETGSALLALSNDLATAVEKAGHAVVAVNARPRTPSSGVHWRQGVVVTADHTVKRHQEITVTLSNGNTVPATLAGRDPGTDLAVLKLESADVPVAEVSNTSSLRVGNVVLAVGRGGNSGLSASLGVISALSGAWRTWRGGQIDQLVRSDVTIFLGFSGGPLLDAQGRVVGINTTGLWRNMALAVPAGTVDRVSKELLEKGRIARAYLGLGMQPVALPDALTRKLKLSHKAGLIVFTVEPGSPAERAGALIGDILIALDEKPVTDMGDVQAFLESGGIGKSVRASFVRGGAPVELAIVLGERPRREE